MGGIDEASLDRLSLVTEMTKHIRVRASGRTGAFELGQFSPIFIWLLRVTPVVSPIDSLQFLDLHIHTLIFQVGFLFRPG